MEELGSRSPVGHGPDGWIFVTRLLGQGPQGARCLLGDDVSLADLVIGSGCGLAGARVRTWTGVSTPLLHASPKANASRSHANNTIVVMDAVCGPDWDGNARPAVPKDVTRIPSPESEPPVAARGGRWAPTHRSRLSSYTLHVPLSPGGPSPGVSVFARRTCFSASSRCVFALTPRTLAGISDVWSTE